MLGCHLRQHVRLDLTTKRREETRLSDVGSRDRPLGAARDPSADVVSGSTENTNRREEMMNIDVTALQIMPELATEPVGLRPKKCLGVTWWKCNACTRALTVNLC